MRKTSLAVAGILALGLTSPAHADRGDTLIKMRGNFHLRSGSDKVPVEVTKGPLGSTQLAHYHVRGDDAVGAEVSATYFVTDHVATEVAFGGVSFNVKESTGDSLASASMITPMITFQYHPMPKARVRPYLGAGAAYLGLYDEKPGKLMTEQVPYTIDAYSVTMKGAVAPVAQVGFDISLDDKMYLNVDAKYLFAKSDIRVIQNGLPETEEQDINTFILGLGVGFRF